MNREKMINRGKRWGILFLISGYTWFVFQILVVNAFGWPMLSRPINLSYYLQQSLDFIKDLFGFGGSASGLTFFLVISLIPTLVFIPFDLWLERLQSRKSPQQILRLRVYISVAILIIILLLFGQPYYKD